MRDWFNETVYQRGELEIVRLDIAMALVGICIFFFYCLLYNWQQAVIAVLGYILVWMCAAWMF